MIFMTGKNDSGRENQAKIFLKEKRKSNGDMFEESDIFYVTEYILERSCEYMHGMGKERCDQVTADIKDGIQKRIESGDAIVVAEEIGCCVSPMAKSGKMAIEVNADVCIAIAERAIEGYLMVKGKLIKIK